MNINHFRMIQAKLLAPLLAKCHRQKANDASIMEPKTYGVRCLSIRKNLICKKLRVTDHDHKATQK